ncbi:MAG: transglutaminase-like putative cysteine protease, partial [Myxococcota bacterium]
WAPPRGRLTDGLLLLGGGLLGAAAGAMVELPPGPVPPEFMGPAVGGLTAMMVAGILAGRKRAWNYSALLIAIALSAEPVTDIRLAGAAAITTVLIAIFLLSGAKLWSGARLVWFLAWLVLTAGITVAGARTMFAAQGLLTPLLEAIVDVNAIAGGLGVQSTVRLAPYSSVSPDTVRVLELDGPPPRYLRGQVMDRFDGTIWKASPKITALREGTGLPQDGDLPLSMLLHKAMRSAVPAPAGTTAVDGEPPVFTVGWLVSGAPWRGSSLSFRRGLELLPTEDGDPPAHTRALPDELASALRPLVASILADAETSREKAEALEAHFQSHHTYSLLSDLRGDGHPLVVLIREERPAYCTYFASAMAAALRADGEATRLIGGFVPAETNPVTGRTLVRSRDAHAWVEVWLPEERRWVRFDPTPSREAVLDLPSPSLLEAALDGVRDAMMRAFLRIRTDPMGLLRDTILSWPVLVLIVAGGGWSLWLRWRGPRTGWRRRRHGPAQTDPALWPLYRRYLRLLERHARLRIVATDSDDEIIARLREHDAEAADAAAEFLSTYRRARYRRREGSVEAVSAALKALRARL